MARPTSPLIEALESRIAPSVVIGVGGRVAHYTDLDGDRVTITVSKGRLSAADFITTSEGATVPDGEALVILNLSDDGGEFHQANLTIVATPSKLGGDGHANVGFINAGDGLTDLGRVKVDGALGRIMAGNANEGPLSPGVKVLIAEAFSGSADEVTGGIAKLLIGSTPKTGIVLDNVQPVGGIKLHSSSTLNLSSGSIVLTGTPIGGTATTGLVKAGTGSLTLSSSIGFTGVSSNTGSATITGGTLQISTPNLISGAGTSLVGLVTGSSSVNVNTLGATLQLSSGTANTITFPSIDPATSSLTKTGSGTLTLTGSATYTGATLVSGGVLVINGSGTIGSGGLIIGSGSQVTAINGGLFSGGGFTLPVGAKLPVGNATLTLGTNNAIATFTAADGSVVDVSGASISFTPPSPGQSNVPTIELLGLDPSTAPTGSKKFEIRVGHDDAALTQNRALYEALIANGWTAATPTLGADGQVASIKFTKPAPTSISV